MMAMIFSKLPGAQEITFEDVIEEQQSLPKLIQKGEFEEIKTYFENNPTGTTSISGLGNLSTKNRLMDRFSFQRSKSRQVSLDRLFSGI